MFLFGMKDRLRKYGFALLVVLSLTSYLYLNGCSEVQKEKAFTEVQELNAQKDQAITTIVYITVAIEKVVDILTTRQS